MKEELQIKPDYLLLSKEIIHLLSIDLQKASKERLVFGIAGESGSGKSVTAVCLSQYLEELKLKAEVLHMDDYFKLPAADNHQNRLKGLENVGPHEVNLHILDQHIEAFRKKETVMAPLSDFQGNCFKQQVLNFKNADVLIVEGTYTLELQNYDHRIFIDRDFRDTLSDRINRGREAFDPFVEKVLQIEHDIIKEYRSTADIIIDKEFKPSLRR
ncbi:uridine kinase family protein [Jiulongibacter sp. NS-SX5]|uniref:uridine kinase family protein n=1 Tax=Jiulongibacter sp. NS-SX5 TaxID=3463854 RepID=UPI0040587C16